jgi:hypothetical protein
MSEIAEQAERSRRLRAKFEHTLAELKPRLTAAGLVDETVGDLMAEPQMPVLAKAFAVAAVAWLFNTLLARQKSPPASDAILPASKQETKDHENPSTIHRIQQTQNARGHKNQGS